MSPREQGKTRILPWMHGWMHRFNCAERYRSQGKTRILPWMHGWMHRFNCAEVFFRISDTASSHLPITPFFNAPLKMKQSTTVIEELRFKASPLQRFSVE
ncbi:MAG: hypothetical protein F6K40_26655 [Okeania sp. SIO3I5]|nr:hypothetical protein [Okeania sp. SIO3I5]